LQFLLTIESVEAKEIRNVVIVGAGNLATSLALAMHRQGINVLQVLNRTRCRGEKLAKRVSADFSGDFRKADFSADLYLIAVSDSAITEVAMNLGLTNQLLVHTSGSTDISCLKEASGNYGVFYPLQTFSGPKPSGLRGVPLCIEANTRMNEQTLLGLARRLSENVHVINSAQRKVLHMTAVFASNFSNFMYSIAEDILVKHDIPFGLLKPLILQTARNTGHEDIFKRQTGPAVREDIKVMDEHREMLAKYEEYMEIYDLISKSIIKHKKRND
jgi:predicted short-subunit dehydrogenase-like oxidoreductase (DUF2520 family)